MVSMAACNFSKILVRVRVPVPALIKDKMIMIKTISDHRQQIELYLKKYWSFCNLKLHDREDLFMPIYLDSNIHNNIRSIEVDNGSGIYIGTITFDKNENILSFSVDCFDKINMEWISENYHYEKVTDTRYQLVHNISKLPF